MVTPPPGFVRRSLLICALCGAPLFAAPAYLAHLQLARSTVEISELSGGWVVPWDLGWGPDDHLWLTVLSGDVWRIDPVSGERSRVATIPSVCYEERSFGLQSMAFHPRFASDPYVYLHYVYRDEAAEPKEALRSRLVRCRWNGTELEPPELIFDPIPGATFHNGSRLAVGPDEKLYLSTGEGGNRFEAPDPMSLRGKVLRLNLDGSIPADNPDPQNPVFSRGHRNPQGLVFSPSGQLYASEHGPTQDDEINLIQEAHDYGWPQIMGFVDQPEEVSVAAGRPVTEPLYTWTPTVAAAGLDFYDAKAIPEWEGHLLLATLKGSALWVLGLSADGTAVTTAQVFLHTEFGRLRDVCVAPNGDVYLVTSNTDWHPRAQPWMYEHLSNEPDRILRLRSVSAERLAQLERLPRSRALTEDRTPLPLLDEVWKMPQVDDDLLAGQALYMQTCAPCHSPDGQGAAGFFPPLVGSEWVTGDERRFIRTVLFGLSGPIEVAGKTYQQEMPSFRHLDDSSLAAILSYVRRGLAAVPSGNVSPSQVGAARVSAP